MQSMKMKKAMAKGTATILAWALMLTSLQGAPALALPASDTPNRFAPPSSLGFLSQAHIGRDPRTVVLVQDLHINYEAQKNISGLLHHWAKKAILPSFIGVEGAQGKIDTSILAGHADASVRGRASDFLIRHGELTGPGAYAVESGKTDVLYGVENAAYYRLNRSLYQKTYEGRRSLASQINKLEPAIEVLKRKHLTRDMRRVQKMQSLYANGQLSHAEYARKLLDQASGLGLSLESYPTLRVWNKQTGSTSSFGSAQQLKNFDHEVNLLYRAVAGRTGETPVQRNLMRAEQEITLLKRLLQQQVMESEIHVIGSLLPQIENNLSHLLSLSARERQEMVEAIHGAIDYYALAIVREAPILENTLALMQERRSDVAVLVVGGFHTVGITQALRERGLSYAVVTPRIEKILPEDEKVYQDRLLDRHLTLSEKGEVSSSFSPSEMAAQTLEATGHWIFSAAPAAQALARRVLLQEARVNARDEAEAAPQRSALHQELVIANHILVSAHAALIFSIFTLPGGAPLWSGEVIRYIFASPETLISIVLWYATFHIGVWRHERAHYWQAVKTLTLEKTHLPEAQTHTTGVARVNWEIKMFLLAPLGKFPGIKKHGLNYYIDAPFNLSVAAAGPQASGRMAIVMLPLAALLIGGGFAFDQLPITLLGRLALGVGAVGLLDRFLADPGKLVQFQVQEKAARENQERVAPPAGSWMDEAPKVKEYMRANRLEVQTNAQGVKLKAPWGFRNSGMGGRHTEKEYPESNISMQEAMFIPLSAKNYEDAQEMTVALQNRLKQIIDTVGGSRVMGIGLEGGLAPYITPKEGEVPELQMWRLMTQAIKDLGYTPGKDVVLALDPATSELENAFREQFEQPDAVGQYLFWRDKNHTVMTREQLLGLYRQAMEEGIPIISIEDGFAEDDWDGYGLMKRELGKAIFIIGDDLVTTNDGTIQKAAKLDAIDTVLTKANQIGTLSETVLAMLTTLGNGMNLVISHRSKSPNDDMEAQIALATEAVGLKAGGGANTERLVKYQAVLTRLQDAARTADRVLGNGPRTNRTIKSTLSRLVITSVTAYEEPTNAGIPTVGVKITAGLPGTHYENLLAFTGATPLGTSAGTGEAIHLVDSMIERSPVVDRHRDLFKANPDGTFGFKKGVTQDNIDEKKDEALSDLWKAARRYEGKGTRNAARYVETTIAPLFLGKTMGQLGNVRDIDHLLLALEVQTASARGKDTSDPVAVAQRKGNLGMNAILSTSLALSRMRAALDGYDLWQLLRQELRETMIAAIIQMSQLPAADLEELDYENLVAQFVKSSQNYQRATGAPINELLRSVMGIYRDLEIPLAGGKTPPTLTTDKTRAAALAHFAAKGIPNPSEFQIGWFAARYEKWDIVLHPIRWVKEHQPHSFARFAGLVAGLTAIYAGMAGAAYQVGQATGFASADLVSQVAIGAAAFAAAILANILIHGLINVAVALFAPSQAVRQEAERVEGELADGSDTPMTLGAGSAASYATSRAMEVLGKTDGAPAETVMEAAITRLMHSAA